MKHSFNWDMVRHELIMRSENGVLCSNEEWRRRKPAGYPTIGMIIEAFGLQCRAELALKCGFRMIQEVTE